MERFVAEIKSVPLAQGFGEVFYPGEMEARNDLRNRKEGIEFPGDTLSDLRRVAQETGTKTLLPWS
jgi:LDH2 family malate/lactate/ureidoglycolate dehydrogenase